MSPATSRSDAQDPDATDARAFTRELDALRAEVEGALSPSDFCHFQKLERWGRTASTLGYATAWLGPNLFSAAALALGSTTRWAIVAHHVSHRAFDRIDGVPERYTSKRFAKGARRFLDWLDWIDPEAWNLEHNILHHAYTGETKDPDLVEENADSVRRSSVPMFVKYAAVGFYALTWKYSYYAPNTFQVLSRSRGRQPTDRQSHYLSAYDVRTPGGRSFWKSCVLPYAGVRFVAIPAAYLVLGPWASFSVFINSLMAEALTNLHSFFVIAPNHAGDDLVRFDGPRRSQAEFYVRQVTSTVNFTTGGDLNDFLHGFLNYQIEHHLFPGLPPSAYQRIQPRVKELCAKYNVPYVQEPVLRRVKKLVDVIVGRASMLRHA